MRRVFFFCVLLVATGATGPRAQTEITTDSEINSEPTHLSDTIVVTANRLHSPIRTIGGAITVITAEQIKTSQAPMASDLLRTVPGISIVRSGGYGQQTSLFMRGANSEHVLVMIDGVELNDPSSPNRAANLANLPTDNIARIEILRGPQSVLYGSDAVAGVIQIFTKHGLGRPTVSLSTEGGSFNTFREQLAIRAGQDDVDYSLMLSRQDSDGTSAASDKRGNEERDGYSNTTLSASFGLRPSEFVDMRFSGRVTEADIDLDQTGSDPDDPNFTMNSKERVLSAQFNHRSRSFWSHRGGFYITNYKRSAIDLVDASHPYNSSRTKYEGRCVKLDWQHILDFGDIGHLTAGIVSERDEMEQSLLFSSAWGDYHAAIRNVNARTTGLYVLDELVLGDRWFTTIGARLDDHSQFGSKPTYRVTTAFLFDELGLKLRATYGTSFKAPSLVQIHDNATGNPDLKPETSEGWEVGAESRLVEDRLSMGVTYFHTSFSEFILFDGTMMNITSASIRGGEIFASYEMPRLTIRADYTNTRTLDASGSGLALVRRPRHKLNLSATGDLTDNLALNLSIDHKGRRADLDFSANWFGERVVLMDYTTVDLGATYQLSSSAEVRVRVENLLDAEYEEVLAFGSPPRGVFVGVTLSN